MAIRTSGAIIATISNLRFDCVTREMSDRFRMRNVIEEEECDIFPASGTVNEVESLFLVGRGVLEGQRVYQVDEDDACKDPEERCPTGTDTKRTIRESGQHGKEKG